MKNPIQPLTKDKHGVLRFKKNALVDALLTHGQNTGLGLNQLATQFYADEHKDDWCQLAQLIGYSLSGFGELSYVDDVTYDVASAMADGKVHEDKARIEVLERELKAIRDGLRMPVARLFGIHPDDLK